MLAPSPNAYQYYDRQPSADYDVDVNDEDVRDAQDQLIKEGLSRGELVLPPAARQRLSQIHNSLVDIDLSPNLDDGQKQEAKRKAFADMTALRRAATPPPPEQIAASADTRRRQLVASLPPELQDKPWQYDSKSGALQYPRGYREEPPGGGGQGQEADDAAAGVDGGQQVGGGVSTPPPPPAVDPQAGFEEDRPAPQGHNLPVFRSRAAFDQFPGGWWVDSKGIAHKKLTRAEHHEQMHRQQFGDERYEWFKKNQVPLRWNKKDQEWVIDSAAWAIQKDLYAREHPEPEKPKEPEKPQTQAQHIAAENFIRGEAEKRIEIMVNRWRDNQVATGKVETTDKISVEDERHYKDGIRPLVEEQVRKEVESWRAPAKLREAETVPDGAGASAALPGEEGLAREVSAILKAHPRSGSDKYELQWFDNKFRWVPVGGQ